MRVFLGELCDWSEPVNSMFIYKAPIRVVEIFRYRIKCLLVRVVRHEPAWGYVDYILKWLNNHWITITKSKNWTVWESKGHNHTQSNLFASSHVNRANQRIAKIVIRGVITWRYRLSTDKATINKVKKRSTDQQIKKKCFWMQTNIYLRTVLFNFDRSPKDRRRRVSIYALQAKVVIVDRCQMVYNLAWNCFYSVQVSFLFRANHSCLKCMYIYLYWQTDKRRCLEKVQARRVWFWKHGARGMGQN